MGMGAVGSTISQLGGLASLAGLNVGGGGTAKDEALATLESQALTDKYIQQNHLLPILFAKAWNPATRSWRNPDPRKAPTLWDANQVFKSIRAVDDNAKLGIVKLNIQWKDPKLAAEWANGIVRMTNDYLRQKAIDEAERSIAYLTRTAPTTNVVEVRNALYGLIEQQFKKETLARGREDFALRVVDPAVPPEQPSSPRTILWIAAGIFAGLFLGLLTCAFREVMRDPNPAQSVREGAHELKSRTEGV